MGKTDRPLPIRPGLLPYSRIAHQTTKEQMPLVVWYTFTFLYPFLYPYSVYRKFVRLSNLMHTNLTQPIRPFPSSGSRNTFV
jgi:hypothetical protein